MPFANLPDTHKSRWGDELTAEKMKECVWLRPEAVAQVEFLEWTAGDRLRALALTDTSVMPRPWEMKGALDLVTADFAYVRWLGNRKGIEE